MSENEPEAIQPETVTADEEETEDLYFGPALLGGVALFMAIGAGTEALIGFPESTVKATLILAMSSAFGSAAGTSGLYYWLHRNE